MKFKYFTNRLFLNGYILFIFSTASFDVSAALNDKTPSYPITSFHIKSLYRAGFIKGRVIQSTTKSPICFANICNSNKTLFTKSNSKGEFIVGPLEFPAVLKINKFGFKEENLIINDQVDSVLISLTPLEVHKSYSGNKKLLQYDLIFKLALEKLRVEDNSGLQDNSVRKLVYCHISSTADSRVNSLFESYAQMEIGRNGLNDYEPSISRYTSDGEISGLTGNKLEFNIYPYISLPIMAERVITRKGYIMQDNNQIAMLTIDLDKTINTYYINVEDTSVLYITSRLRSEKKEQIKGTQAWQKDRYNSADISFSYNENKGIYIIDCISTSEEFKLVQKNKPDQTISKSTLFAVVPDSSIICNAVRDQVANEALTELRQQINFRAKYLTSGNSSTFDLATEKLLLKPYMSAFWTRNSFIMPVLNEQRQIASWENKNLFYSEESRPPEKEMISADSIAGVMNKNLVAVENVYVETDRTDYFAGDTIWFSAFVLDNLHMDSTSLSRILYVDLINADNRPEKHLKLIINDGRSHGDFILNKDAKNGIYRLRAYTQYMRNFQGQYLFEKDIPVHQSDFSKMIMVNPVIHRSIGGDSVELHLQTILPDEYNPQDKTLEVIARLNDTLSVRKTFNIKRSLNGWMGFFVPSSLSCPTVDIKLILSGKAVISEQRLSVPLKSGINLQFFPESGKMVDGITTVIACKATDNKGYPAEFKADITDENNNLINQISGDSSGVCKFEFTPVFKHNYRALVNLSGSKYSFDLPAVEPQGYVLNFNAASSDILIKNNQFNVKAKHYLLVSVRGEVYAAIETRLDDKPFKIHLPMEMYPKGIVQVTLFDSLLRPQAERLVFNNRPDKKMFINIETDKKVYSQREKVNLTINVTDVEGNPVSSSLSLAVVDGSKSDPALSSPDIESYLYLTSELKGRIDYRLLNLSDTTSEGNKKRDLVMMTQGWRNFLWNSIRYTNTLKVRYPVEKGFCIDGTVFNPDNRKSGSIKLNYLDFKSGFNGFTKIDGNNRFKIEMPFFYNSHVLFLQNRNEKEKIGKLGFSLDTFPVPAINYRNNELPYGLIKAGYLGALDKKFTEIDSANGPMLKYIHLGEVKITAKADRIGYSAPDKTIDLMKKDPTGKKYYGLFQMIYEEFGEKAFTATGPGTRGKTYNPILVVNGAPLTASECPPCYDFVAYRWAASIPVNAISEVKFFEVESKYSQWLSPPPPAPTMGNVRWKTDALGTPLYMLPQPPKLYFPVVSLKTYSNSYRGIPSGTIIFPFQGIYEAREFYQPDYENIDNKIPDNRTTIYWNPEVQTDWTGTAKVSFYNSDLKGKALIRISGFSFFLKDASFSSGQYLSQ
jgi:hypothetical protein